MKRMVMIAVAMVLLSGVLVALAQDKPAAKDDGAMGMCPACCKMTADGSMSKEMMDTCKEMMKDAGITDEMMMMHKGMMAAPMYADDPAVLLGMAKGLTLTDDQKAKLMEIQKDARAKAAAVLTDDQKKMLGKTADKPMCTMDCMKMMRDKMMPVLEKRMKEGKKLPPCCEMMMKMKDAKMDMKDMKPADMPK